MALESEFYLVLSVLRESNLLKGGRSWDKQML